MDTAETAREALAKLGSHHYDLALIDVILPDMRGTELLVEAKKELTHTGKCIITGYPSGEIGAKARDEGADAFILKPIRMQELLSIIQVFLGEEQTVLSKEEQKLAFSGVDSGLTTDY